MSTKDTGPVMAEFGQTDFGQIMALVFVVGFCGWGVVWGGGVWAGVWACGSVGVGAGVGGGVGVWACGCGCGCGCG